MQQGSIEGLGSAVSGANVFILFDTSNYMYKGRGFVYAQDAIADFVRTLDSPYRVAFYSYSRDFFRAASLTTDRSQVLRGVRSTVNGDDSALYNALLMTLKDAAQYSGRKVVVVFSNGPDNSSMVAPEDVDELAQSQGIPIYMISTREAKLDPATAAVFERMSASTGGEAYSAKNWRDERQAFAMIREDLAHLYFVSYYPQPNPNRGWRAITVKLKDPKLKKYKLRTRSGYRPIPAHVTVDAAAPAQEVVAPAQ
jgi:Ca-activated chloride channel homolog